MRAAAQPAPAIWRGLALGNLASIEIRHADPAQAARLLDLATMEIARLESILSLYRPDSALSRLNRDGILRDPPLDLVRVLASARDLGAVTGGAFDVTVQPLWQAYADHFGGGKADPAGPSATTVSRTLEKVGYRALEIEPSVVGLNRAGMAVTLNGIAQGYITDRIAELLRDAGLEHVLVDLGEIRALGARDGAVPWRAGIQDPAGGAPLAAFALTDQALSTSGSYGFRFDASGRFHHIFDPRSGTCPQLYASVSVLAPSATIADALATAGNLLPPDALAAALKAAGADRALLVETSGAQRWIVA
jgi:thiamine biosynthesis lipoprotein